ncbi:hypothetical protein SY83_21425 [Paenibacillus swuensis]|uniref:F5/8 type C domain-containing protein n=1 Tax=Paenibacillus swuensis TaxID=1178515 RepID=A0A172TNE5_9BACL|nr:discoidin domain-containing protein [Paenibacillus swuensis]ANE48414.1 hypothetical protein SY83_21425 [Paenibacillus swuensis]
MMKKTGIKLLLLVWCFTLMFGHAGGFMNKAEAAATGKFHIEGNQIIDPNGNPFIINGTNISGYNWVWELDMSTDSWLNTIKNVWKFNTVRVNNKIGGTQYHKDKQYLYNLIDKYINNNVVVQVEAHDFSGSYYTDTTTPSLTELADFHKDLATRYKNHPKGSYLWFNVMNEPGYNHNPVPQQYVDTHKRVIDAIRSTGNESIIIVDGDNFANDTVTYNGSQIGDSESGLLSHGQTLLNHDPLKNLTFSIHMYGGWQYGDAVLSNGKTRFTDFKDRVFAKGLSFHVGEYGMYNGTFNNTGVASVIKNEVVPNNIGRISWHAFSGDLMNDHVTVTCGNISCVDRTDGVAKPTNLTPFGSLVWDLTHPPVYSASGSCNAGESAAKAFDGQQFTKWCAGTAAKWLQVDFGTSYDITKFYVGHAGSGNESGSYNTKAFEILTSNDGTNWTPQVSVNNNTSSATTHTINAVQARYVRLNITQAEQSGNNAARIYEFKVLRLTNVALNQPATVDGNCSFDSSGSSAVDGFGFYPNTKWCNNNGNAVKWLKVDLRAVKTLSKFVVGHAGSGGETANANTKDFTIDTSMDGVNWTNRVTVTGNTANTTTHTISPADARYVRLSVTKAEQGQYNTVRIYEFQAFGIDK